MAARKIALRLRHRRRSHHVAAGDGGDADADRVAAIIQKGGCGWINVVSPDRGDVPQEHQCAIGAAADQEILEVVDAHPFTGGFDGDLERPEVHVA